MDLMLRVSSQPGYKDTADYAVVRIKPEFAQHAVRRIDLLSQLKQQDSCLSEMVYSDDTAHFFRWHEDLRKIVDLGYDAVEAVVDSDGYAMLETEYTVPEAAYVNVEDQSIVVRDDSIYWKARMTNTNIITTTYSVSVELLRGLAIQVDD